MAKNMTMNELACEYSALDELLQETEGEITPEIEALIQELDGKAEEKLERVALYILGQRGQAKSIKEEEARLAARRKQKEKGADGLLAFLERTMHAIGKERIEGLLVTLNIQLNPPSVNGELDEGTLRTLIMIDPALVNHQPETWSLNKRAVLDAHKAGKLIPTGLTVERSSSLRIR